MSDFSYIQNRKSIYDFDYKGKTVLIRVDFNVPISNTLEVLDDIRIREALPTINYVLEKGGKIVLVSHFKRPKGWEENKSLKPIAKKLEEILKKPILFLTEKIGSEELKMKIEEMSINQVALLENIRFYTEETENKDDFSKELSSLCDIYLNDAFGTMHRAHASTAGITKYVKDSGLGLLPLKELEYIDKLVNQAKKPLTVILGGGKVSTKIKLLEGLMDYADNILIGGGMVFTFLKAMGYSIGKSLYEEECLSTAKSLLESQEKSRAKLFFPVDIVCALDLKEDVGTKIFVVKEGIPNDMMGLDIGPESIKEFSAIIQSSKTVFWNGPVGVFEISPFDVGTRAIAQSIGNLTQKAPDVMTLVGGGESAMAARLYGIANMVTHISTGGGALLELLEGVKLPGILAIPTK